MNEQNERPGLYKLYLRILYEVCHEIPCIRDQEDMDKLIEYGWVRRKEMAVDYTPLFEGEVRCDCYVLTAKGHFMLCPRENRVEEPLVPFFPASGHITWDGFYLLNWWKS